MRLNITQKIAGLLIAAVCGAIITGVFSYSYFVQTSGDVPAVNVAGRQRMLSRVLYEYATMVHNGQDEDRKVLRTFVVEFDEALATLEFGGVVLGHKLSPAPSEVLNEIRSTKRLWRKIKVALIAIADGPTDDPESVEAYRFVCSSIDQLTEVSDLVVSALELRSMNLRRKTLLVIVLTIVFDFAFLLIGVWTLRRYINDRKTATKVLRITQFSVDNAGEAAFRIRPDGKFTYVNASACHFAGRTPVEMLSLFLWDVDSNLSRQAWPELWQGIRRRGTISMEREFRRRDGRVYVIEVRADYLQYDGSEYAFGFVTDITERKQAEKTNALLSRAIEQAGEIIVITDAEGTIQYVNPAFERITGYTAEEAIGHNPRILKSGQHDKAFYRGMWESLSSGKEWHGEIINKRKDGTLFTEQASITPVFDSQGTIVNYVAVKSDITETKRLQELETRAQRLEAAGQIAGQLAHDFNNLLGPLVAYPDLIRDELTAEHPALEYLEVMQNSAIQMAEINQQLLTLGRRGHYLQKPIDLNRVLSQTIKQISDLPQDVEIHPDTAPDLKPVMGGSSQLGRVILNLIVNAIDAMPAGGQITLRTENRTIDQISGVHGPIPAGEYVVFTVADSGCGIPSETLPNIFEPFFTSKKTDSKRGSGLGLSVVATVVEDHGGYINVNSTPGSGTSFILYFPVTQQIPEAPESSEIQHGTEIILIVDDDKSQRIVCARLLDKLGYQTNVKESGEAAIDFLKTNPHDLLLLDMKLGPGIDGTETFRRSLQINPEQRAIIISGLADTDRVQTALQMGVGAFLKKPITLEALGEAVRAELDRPLASRDSVRSVSA